MAEISDEAYEELRLILEEQYRQKITPEDVKEIGDGLIDFCTLLLQFSKVDKNNFQITE